MNPEQPKTMDKKKLILFILAAIVIVVLLIVGYNAFKDQGVSTLNANFYSATDSTVYFKPVCPDCNHIGDTYGVNLSPGEEYRTVEICERCYALFDLEVKRSEWGFFQ